MSDNPHLTILRREAERIRNTRAFSPSEEQKRARAAFWASYELEVGTPQGPVNLSIASRFAGTESIVEWWVQPGFADWFNNSNEFSQRTEYLTHLALGELEQVLITAPDADTKLKCIRMIMELGKKFPARVTQGDTPGKFLDASIAKMSREQLVEFLRIKTARLLPSPSEEDK